MKVLMIAPEPFFEPRGTPISVYQRLKGLSSLGHEVDLVTYHIGSKVEISGVKIHRAPRFPGINQVKIGPSFAKIPLDILLFLKTVLMLLSNRYDVIHSHEEAAFFAALLSIIFRIPHIYDMHSSLPKQLATSNFCNCRPLIKIFELLERFVLNTCDVVLTIGSDLEDYVLYVNQQANHLRIENTAVQSNPSSKNNLVFELRDRLELHDHLSIVYTGNFEQYQGLEILFKGMKKVIQTNPNVKLIMVGGKPDQVTRLAAKAKQLGLSDHLIFTGIVPLDESLIYLEVADILVSPRIEGLSIPLKIYSYLYSGKPIIATNIVAHTQILEENTAVFVEPNPTSWAIGLTQLIDEPELRTRIGSQARAYAEREFSTEGYVSKLKRAYLAILFSKSIDEVPVQKSYNPAQTETSI